MNTKFTKRWNWLASAGLFALLLVSSLTITPAQAQPPGPPGTQQFYGYVYINGGLAPATTTVAAHVNGILNASTTVDSQGRYGYSPLFTATGTDGQAVTFYVGGNLAPQTVTFQGGAITRLDLYVVTTTLSVSTNAATDVGSRIATLNGNLTSMGGFSSVNVHFQYGTTPSFGSTTSTQSKTSTGAFTASLSSLTPNTLYYFRAVATSGSTTVYGTTLSFTTTTPALNVTTSAATGVTATGATLNGNLVDLGTCTSVSVYFQYGTTPSYGSSTTPDTKTATGTFNKPVTGLLSNTTYNFRAVAQCGSTTVYGSNLTFTTPTGSLGVTTGSATDISCMTATLNGTLTSLGSNSSVGVHFKYGLTTSYGSTTPSQTMALPGSFSAPISGLNPSTTYHFQAVAVGSTTVTGSDVTFTTPACGGGGPPPHQFYGYVYINGTLAGSGATVAAYVNGSPTASTTTDPLGRYGWTTIFQVLGTNGATVTFYVNGALVPQTATWSSGGMSRLNLYSTTPTGLTITTPSLANGTVGVAYSATLQASGGTTPYTWSIISGSLPAGLTLTASTGAISGTPTGPNGTANFTAKVTDSASPTPNTATKPLSITIGPAGTLTITTTSLPNGTISVAYSTTLQATGGTTPYTWSIISGSLPAGLTLTASTGAITGTPTTEATSNFTVQVTDAVLGTATKPLSITIGSSPSPGDCGSQKLIGAENNLNIDSDATNANVLRLIRFNAETTGNVTVFKIKCARSGNVKVAIYADSGGGEPGALLNAVNTPQPVVAVAGWNCITFPSTAVNSGGEYWLAAISDTKKVIGKSTKACISRYKSATFSTFTFPDPAGTGFSSQNQNMDLFAGWQ